MMIDPFVLLTPVLLLAVIALLRFVGCNQVFGLDETVLEADPADPPTFDPQPGTFGQTVSVTLSDATPDATIYYTTDSSQPTIPPTGTTQIYTGPILISYTTGIRAIATAPSKNKNSLEAAATYIILPITYRQSRARVLPATDTGASLPGNQFTSEVLAGSLMVVLLSYNSAAQSVAGMTDSAGNVYQRAVGPTTGAGALAGSRQEIWYATLTNGGLNLVITATFTQVFTGQKAMSAHEYSGADQMEPLDLSRPDTGTSADASSGSAMTTAARLIFGGAVFEVDGAPDTIAGFNLRTFAARNIAEDKQVTSPGPVEATFKNTPQQWIAQMVAFK